MVRLGWGGGTHLNIIDADIVTSLSAYFLIYKPLDIA